MACMTELFFYFLIFPLTCSYIWSLESPTVFSSTRHVWLWIHNRGEGEGTLNQWKSPGCETVKVSISTGVPAVRADSMVSASGTVPHNRLKRLQWREEGSILQIYSDKYFPPWQIIRTPSSDGTGDVCRSTVGPKTLFFISNLNYNVDTKWSY